jgi:hypothetical protein
MINTAFATVSNGNPLDFLEIHDIRNHIYLST